MTIVMRNRKQSGQP